MKRVVRIAASLAVALLVLAVVAGWLIFPPESIDAGVDFPRVAGPYLGQTPPGASAERFAPGIVGRELHTAVVFSPDGQEAYWRAMGEEVNEIVVSRLEGDRWSPPQVAPFASRFFDSDDPCFSPDGERLFFTSWRPLAWHRVFEQKERIWYVERTARGWSRPKPVGPAVNEMELHWQVSVSAGGTLCFASEGDIYCALFEDEQYQLPERLDGTINTTDKEGHPFLAPDESYLIFSSSGGAGGMGDYDLYVSVHNPDDSWGEAKNLGAGVNSRYQELYPVVSPDGSYLFFLSNRGGALDVYWVDFEVVGRLISE